MHGILSGYFGNFGECCSICVCGILAKMSCFVETMERQGASDRLGQPNIHNFDQKYRDLKNTFFGMWNIERFFVVFSNGVSKIDIPLIPLLKT